MELLPSIQRALRGYLGLRGVRSAWTRLGDLDVHYYSLAGEGRGPPVVLVHGLGGSANGFHKILFGLARRFSHVYAPDLPGNGFSPLPLNTPGLGVRRQLEVLESFMEQVVRRPVFLVGTSLGGAMAITLAQRHPGWVLALALVSPAGAQVAEERLRELHRLLSPRGVEEARALTRRLFHRAPLSTLLLAPDMYRMYITPAVRAVLGEFSPKDFLDPVALGQLEAPTLLIWGGSEKLLPYEGVEFFRRHLPSHAEVHEVEGFGHVPQMERPAELVRKLTGFADRVGL